MASHSKFLDYLTSEWGRDIPLKNLWTVHFTDIKRLSQSISNILYSAENINNNRTWPIISDVESDQDNEQGVMVAQSVLFPTNSFSIDNSTNTNMGGLRPGYIGSQRTPYSDLQIEFLETNIDIIDYFFRPWIIAATHKGLIEDNDTATDIKCDVYVSLYSRVNREKLLADTLSDQWELRKTFRFDGVVPANVFPEKLSMGDMNISNVIKAVDFRFSNFTLLTEPSMEIVEGAGLS